MKQWPEAKKVLCVRLDAMGDLLMTTPAMKAFKDSLPGRSITLLTSQQGAQLASSIPFIDEVIPYSAPWLKASEVRSDTSFDFEMIERLKKEKFDGVIIFTVYSQNPLPSALMCFLAGIPLRAAFCRENPYALLTDWVKEEEPEKILRHEVRRHLDLVKHLGAQAENHPLSLKIDHQSHITMMEKLKAQGINESGDWVIIHPGATAASRRYEPAHFAKLADLLIKKKGKKVIFTGGKDERKLIEVIQAQMNEKSENMGGLLSLKEMIALVGLSPILISNNSGPVHIAAALGTPVVVLYALTNPQHTPWMIPHEVLFHDVPCRFCYKSICPEGTNACLNSVQPETVFSRVESLMDTQRVSRYDMKAVHPLGMGERSRYDYAGK